MRLLIVGDLHANAAALERVAEAVDAVCFLGDAVDYGPDPAPAVAWVREHADFAVRGNHDEAVAHGSPTRANLTLRPAAEASARWTREHLAEEDRAFLGQLPVRRTFDFAGARFEMLHGAPSDPLYRYLPPETSERVWRHEVAGVQADWLLLGHTHRPLVRRFGDLTVLNPGSVGQPRAGAPLASYAVWDDGDVLLVHRRYEVEWTVDRLTGSGRRRTGISRLIRLLRSGSVR